jgi:TRAP-type uncharacterized transport system substrate-binding protein
MGRRGFLALAGLFAFSAAIAFAFHLATAPTLLRLAVGPIGSEDVRMAAAFVQGLAREKSSVRLKLVLTDGLAESARKLDQGAADLAIVRPDIGMPLNAQTVLITRRFFPFFATSRATGIERITDLRGRRIGLVNTPAGNLDLLRSVLAYYDIALDEVTVVGLQPSDIPEAARSGRIEAMFNISALSSRALTPGVATTRTAWGAEPVFIPIREADALAARDRAIETGEIVRGAFGGDPPRPDEPLKTISITHRLVADVSVADTATAELIRQILTQRPTLTAQAPSLQGIEAPPTAKDAPLPVHRGAAAYLDGEERSFFDRYGDWFYLGVMAMSLLGSGVAAMLSSMTSARRRVAMEGLTRIMAMIAEVRELDDVARLDAIEVEADAILSRTLSDMASQMIDEAGLSAYRLAMDQLGRAVMERRRVLLDPAHGEVT